MCNLLVFLDIKMKCKSRFCPDTNGEMQLKHNVKKKQLDVMCM